MKLILTRDVERLGNAGEVVDVKDGYGRNYLLPKGVAIKWTKGAQKQIDLISEARRKRIIGDLDAAHELREKLETQSVTVSKIADDNGHLFGSVSAADIAQAVSDGLGASIDRRAITIASPIKSLGEHEVSARLHDDVTATIKVTVLREATKKKR